MISLNKLFTPPPREFIDSLSASKTQPIERFSTPNILAGLVALCLLPRAILGCLLTAVCDDGYYYFAVAEALELGRITSALSYLNLNVYPAVLALLHHLGLEWVVAGKLWGLLVSTLLVLPLFGWVRRMFDDRIASIACIIYAIHPEVVELSTEPTRETTFWFFTTLFMYLALRATIENKWWLFVLSGIVLTLAAHTRTEGWLLLLPVMVWAITQFRTISQGRLKLVGGVTLCLAMCPLLLLLVNVTLLRNHSSWEWGRLEHFKTAYHWICASPPDQEIPITFDLFTDSTPITLTSAFSPPGESNGKPAQIPTVPALTESSAVAANSDPGAVANAVSLVSAESADQLETSDHKTQSEPVSAPPAWWIYCDEFINAMEPSFLVVLLIGLIVWRRSLFQRDKAVLWLITLVVLLGVWIRLKQIGSMNGRYFLTIFFMLVPFAASGTIGLLDRIGTLCVKQRRMAVLRPFSPSVWATLWIVAALIDASTSSHPGREAQVALGQWLQQERGPFESVVVDHTAARVGYSARGSLPTVKIGREPVEKLLIEHKPQLVVLSVVEINLWDDVYRQTVFRYLSFIGLGQLNLADIPVKQKIKSNYLVFAAQSREPERLRNAEQADHISTVRLK